MPNQSACVWPICISRKALRSTLKWISMGRGDILGSRISSMSCDTLDIFQVPSDQTPAFNTPLASKRKNPAEHIPRVVTGCLYSKNSFSQKLGAMAFPEICVWRFSQTLPSGRVCFTNQVRFVRGSHSRWSYSLPSAPRPIFWQLIIPADSSSVTARSTSSI